jgi:hypothetical protein
MSISKSFTILASVFTIGACGSESPTLGADASDETSSPLDALRGIPVTAVSSQILSAMPQSAVALAAGEGLEEYYISPSPSVCTDEWTDFGCDGQFPLFPPEDNCAGELRIDYDTEVSCPVCLDPPPAEPTCDQVRRRYLEFLDHNLRETCTNWCESSADCVLWEVDQCGLKIDFALRGLVDEEPLAFAESFAIDNCHVCEGEPPFSQSLEASLDVDCRDHQCVIVVADSGPNSPNPDAGP